MTMYTEDVDYRMRTVFAILVVLSAILGWVLYDLVPAYPRIVAPATLAFYGALFWLFDAILWKLPIIRLLNSGIPQLAGIWKGQLSRNVNGKIVLVDAELTIKQTWSKLDLILKTPEAVSRNTLAGLRLANPKGTLLTWVFLIDGTNPLSLTEKGKGIIELQLIKTSEGATFTGSFMEATPADGLAVKFVRREFFFWNPKPF